MYLFFFFTWNSLPKEITKFPLQCRIPITHSFICIKDFFFLSSSVMATIGWKDRISSIAVRLRNYQFSENDTEWARRDVRTKVAKNRWRLIARKFPKLWRWSCYRTEIDILSLSPMRYIIRWKSQELLCVQNLSGLRLNKIRWVDISSVSCDVKACWVWSASYGDCSETFHSLWSREH